MDVLRTTSVVALLVGLATPVMAERIGGVKTTDAARKLCPSTLYDNSVQGAWSDGNSPVLAFRISWDNDGTACYAWLNAVPTWDIGSTGSAQGSVKTSGDNLQFTNDFILVTFNTEASRAIFQHRGHDRKTLGHLD